MHGCCDTLLVDFLKIIQKKLSYLLLGRNKTGGLMSKLDKLKFHDCRIDVTNLEAWLLLSFLFCMIWIFRQKHVTLFAVFGIYFLDFDIKHPSLIQLQWNNAWNLLFEKLDFYELTLIFPNFLVLNYFLGFLDHILSRTAIVL